MQASIQQFSHYPAWPPPLAVPLLTVPEHSCPYLPGQKAQTRAIFINKISPELYHQFMDAGFRRSGRLLYQPVCAGCRACVPIRIPVGSFRPSRSQRRCRKKNADLLVTIGLPQPTEEKHELYCKYLRQWHGQAGDDSWEDFLRFLYDSPAETIEFVYRDPAGALLAVSLCDVSSCSLSSVYCWFDTAHFKRGLGTYAALREIEYACNLGIPYYYLGYWVRDCPSMSYKSSFRPYELLGTDGIWRRAVDHACRLTSGAQ